MLRITKFADFTIPKRKALGLTKADIARSLGYSKAFYTEIENGTRYPFVDAERLTSLGKLLSLTDSEMDTLRDLAFLARNQLPPEIFEYISNTENVIKFLRVAQNIKLSSEDFEKMITQIEKEAGL